MVLVPDHPVSLEGDERGVSMIELMDVANVRPADCQILASAIATRTRRIVTSDYELVKAASKLKARFDLEVVSY